MARPEKQFVPLFCKNPSDFACEICAGVNFDIDNHLSDIHFIFYSKLRPF